jgi:hypothetical protein
MGRALLRVSAGRVCVVAAAAFAAMAPAAARAQSGVGTTWPTGQPDPVLTGPGGPVLFVPRPRFSAGVGMGATFDPVGFDNAGAHSLPAFFGVGGIGDGFWGFDFLAYASSGLGRARKYDPIDRLGLDLFGVVRPAARVRPDDQRYRYRVLRTVAAELGLGLERVGRATSAGTRFVVHTGARVEFPLTPPNAGSELRVRLGVRRDFGLYTPTIRGSAASDITHVHDTVAELYGALVLVF